jgi:hypothetical protein
VHFRVGSNLGAGSGHRGRHARLRTWCLIGLVCSACLVGKLEVNPSLTREAAGSSSGGSQDGKSGESGIASAGQDGSEGGSDGSGAGSGTTAGNAGTGNVAPQGGGGADDGSGGAPPSVVNCDGYAEEKDGGNNAVSPDANGSAEGTGQNVSDGVEVCGRLNVNHFAGGVVDVDTFSFDVPTATEIFATVELFDDAPAEVLELVVTSGTVTQRVTGTPQRAAVALKLPAGKATVSLVVRNASALTQELPYVISVREDDSAERCAKVAPAAADGEYAESEDGAGNDGNDFIRPDPAIETQSLTDSADDLIEDTGLSLLSGTDSLITGTLAQVSHGDAYLDGDAYQIKAYDDQLTVRVDWAGSTSDLDIWLFKQSNLRPVGRATQAVKSGPEQLTVAVEHGQAYWLWVGASSDSMGLPKNYEVSLCARSFGQ